MATIACLNIDVSPNFGGERVLRWHTTPHRTTLHHPAPHRPAPYLTTPRAPDLPKAGGGAAQLGGSAYAGLNPRTF